jgi:hypothetical protein
MTDRASATIRIGGAIAFDLLPALLEAIECDGGSADWEGKPVDLSSISENCLREVCAYELIGGEFDHVETFCNRHGISYVRISAACAGAFGAQRVVHTGDGLPAEYEINESEMIVLTRTELNELGSIDAANSWFEMGEFMPLPIEVSDGA